MVRALRIVAPFAGAVVALTAIMLVALLVLRLIFPLVAIPLSLTLPHLDLGEDPSVISVADALEQPYGEVTVTGDLYVQGRRPDRICEQVVTGAAGPRCVGGSLRVVDLENSPQGHALIRDRPASGDVLTEAGVHLYGHLKDGVLIIPPPTM